MTALATRRLRASTGPTLKVAALLAGCGGSTSPTGYQCIAPQNPYGCYTQLDISHAHINPDSKQDIANDPVAIATEVSPGQLSCDAAFRASSGTGNPSGAIANFIELHQSSTGWFMHLGYQTNADGMDFYMDYQLDIEGGQYHYLALGSVSTGLSPDGDSLFCLGEANPETPTGASTPTWLGFVAPTLAGHAFAPTTFHPNHAYFGQSIYGTADATATLAEFTGNNVYTAPISIGHPGEVLTEDGTLPGAIGTTDHPTYAP